MKAKISIRFISSLLCMAMVFGIFTLDVFASETAILFDNGSSTFEAGRENYGSENVGDLWKGINAENGSEDSILFDYDYVVNAAASTGIYNSVAEEGFEIGTDKSNAGEITVEIYVSIYGKNEYGEYVSHDIRRSASFGYSEYDLKGNPRDNYLCWSFGDYNTEFITISGGGEDLSISISGTLKDIAAHMKENGSDVEICDSISVGVVVNGRAYYNRAYGTVDYKSEYVDSVWMTVHDAHSREVLIEDFPAMSMKNAIEVVDVLAEDDSFRFFGREALAKLSNSKALLHAYDQLVKGVELAEATISVSNGTDPLSPEEFVTVMDTYIRDYAHHFWLGNGYSYSTSGGAVVSVSPAYTMSGKTLENARETFDQKAEEILSGIEDSMSDYEKELYIHDTLAGMIEYTEGTNAHNAYGALVEGKAVCEGYAESFQYLLHRAGIRSFIITGSSINPSTGNPEGHAWNLVRINGNYYHTDLTWNDQGDELFHAYFNQTDAIIEEDHAINATAYALPECDSAEAQYFTGKPEYLSEYTVDSVTEILQNNCYNAHVYVPDSPESFITWYGNNIVAIATKAGVIGGFSYGYSSLGREVAVYLDFTCTHPSLTFVPALAPTCTEEGHSEYYKCYCGKWFSDSGAENEITDKNSVIIAAAGHDFGDWETVTEATSTTPGEERRECKNCDHYESREIPVKEYSVGDINLDGEVNVKDVYTARLIAAKLIAPTNQQKDLGDVDGDGKITAIDANIIRKYLAHIIGSIPI